MSIKGLTKILRGSPTVFQTSFNEFSSDSIKTHPSKWNHLKNTYGTKCENLVDFMGSLILSTIPFEVEIKSNQKEVNNDESSFVQPEEIKPVIYQSSSQLEENKHIKARAVFDKSLISREWVSLFCHFLF
jgi:hypothetical protein